MTKQETPFVTFTEQLKNEIFQHHSIDMCIEDNSKMYFQYINNEINEDALGRQTATETFFAINHVLTCIKNGIKPEDIVSFTMPLHHV